MIPYASLDLNEWVSYIDREFVSEIIKNDQFITIIILWNQCFVGWSWSYSEKQWAGKKLFLCMYVFAVNRMLLHKAQALRLIVLSPTYINPFLLSSLQEKWIKFFVSFLDGDSMQAVEIHTPKWKEPCHITWSMLWLLISWQLKSPRHQQAWHQLHYYSIVNTQMHEWNVELKHSNLALLTLHGEQVSKLPYYK